MPDTFTYPLSNFYSRAKLPLPPIETIPGAAVPAPYQALLLPPHDLTPTLEAFHQSRIHLDILSRDHRGSFYYREAVLRLDHDEAAVKFGANKIYLGLFQRRLALADARLGHGNGRQGHLVRSLRYVEIEGGNGIVLDPVFGTPPFRLRQFQLGSGNC